MALARFLALLIAAAAAPAADALVLSRALPSRHMAAATARPAAAPAVAPLPAASISRVAAPRMGLFGLGAPELAIIAGVALLILGPEQVKKMAKEVGKASAELKQVPEEFNKGMATGAAELEAKKASAQLEAEGETKPPPPSDKA